MTDFDPHRVKASAIRERLMLMAAEASPSKGLAPDAVARAIAGKDEKIWRRLMAPIKAEAIRLAEDGKVVVLRKGKPTDPHRIRGLYRIRLRGADEPAPAFETAPTDDARFAFDDD